MSVVCVCACAAAQPRFTGKMWANLAPPPPEANGGGGKTDVVLVEMRVRSSTSPGAVVAAEEDRERGASKELRTERGVPLTGGPTRALTACHVSQPRQRTKQPKFVPIPLKLVQYHSN